MSLTTEDLLAQEEIENEKLRDQLAAMTKERDELQDKCNNFASKCRTAIAESDALNLELQKRDKCSYMGPMRDCPTHGESEQLAAMTQERDKSIRNESAIRTLMECYQLGGCTDHERLARDLAAMTQERDDLLAEKSRWIARANNYLGQACENVSANSMLIAAQADNARLREAMEYWMPDETMVEKHEESMWDKHIKMLQLQTDHTALDARLKEERDKCARGEK